MSVPESLTARLTKVKLFLCDVDGIVTDGRVIMGDGKEYKSYDIQDGLGMVLLKRHGVRVGWISNRPSESTSQRAEDLKIDFVVQAKGSKVAAIENILTQTGCRWDEVCYMGDDVVDLGALARAGAAITVPNAIEEVKAMAQHVTFAHGGHGAVREVVKLILRAQGKWDDLIREYSA